MVTLADLKIGQTGIIKEFSSDIPHIKLLEMGCLPGSQVELVQVAPLKDPIYFIINGSHIALRRVTAQKIELDIL